MLVEVLAGKRPRSRVLPVELIERRSTATASHTRRSKSGNR
jgi:hypothetical protein